MLKGFTSVRLFQSTINPITKSNFVIAAIRLDASEMVSLFQPHLECFISFSTSTTTSYRSLKCSKAAFVSINPSCPTQIKQVVLLTRLHLFH